MPQAKGEPVSREQIELRAYELYLASGCVDGRDLENWLAAEEELRSKPEQHGTALQKNSPVAAQRGKPRHRLSKSAAS